MTVRPELVNDDHWLHGALYVLELKDVAAMPDVLQLPRDHHACLILWNSAEESVEVISGIIDTIRAAGCVSFCAWGDGCGRVENEMDSAEVMAGLGKPDDESVVMTTSHQEPLDEALFYFLNIAGPDEAHDVYPRIGLVLSTPHQWVSAPHSPR